MKTKRIFSLFLTLFTGITLFAQENGDKVIMTVNAKPVYKSEFEAIFKKNLRDSVITREALDEYMNLFVNFKLKVTEAEELGLDTNRKFKDELFGYRKQLAKPYLMDNQLNDELIKEAYERLKTEVRASHILVKCELDADPKDSLAAYKRAMKARELAMKDFVKAAQNFSDDPSVKKNNGDIGYFTAMQMVYPFESAAYEAKVGDVTMPVRTRFGYHILKVTDRRPARGTIKVAHILIAAKEEDPQEAKDAARKKADEIYHKILKGEDFSMLAKQHSDDQSSNKKGGELPPFSTGRMVEPFENAAFALKNDGDVSGILQTAYGFHIIKRLEYKSIESFDELKGNIKTKLTRDSRAALPRKSFVNKLKMKYNFKEDPGTVKPFYFVVDTSIFNGEWSKEKASHLKAKMFEFAGKVYTQRDFAEYLQANQRKSNKEEVQAHINNWYERWVSNTLIDYEDSKLEENYPEFRMLMKEYRDGILLFELTDQKVWSKAVKDSSGLAQFYEKNKTNYMWPERYDVDLFYCANASLAKKLRKDLKKGKLDDKKLLEKYNKDSQLNLKIDSGVFSIEDKDMVKKHTPVQKGLSPDYSEDGQILIIRTKNIIKPQPKTISEAKGVITNDYQGWLEKDWLESLKRKYPFTIDRDVLYSIK